MNLLLIRERFEEKQTLGRLEVYDGDELIYECKTLELPWRDNKIKESCIPEGQYRVVHRHSKKYGHHLWVLNTEPRTYILFHAGNFYYQLEGCILPGKAHIDIDGDGLLDVTRSRATLNELLDLVPSSGARLDIVTLEQLKNIREEERSSTEQKAPSLMPLLIFFFIVLIIGLFGVLL